MEAWERAVGAFPAENLTAAQQKQKDQYQGELAAAKAKLDDLLAHPREPQGIVRLQDGDQLPWNRAAAMLPELQRTGVWASSVSVRLELISRSIPTLSCMAQAWVADYTYQVCMSLCSVSCLYTTLAQHLPAGMEESFKRHERGSCHAYVQRCRLLRASGSKFRITFLADRTDLLSQVVEGLTNAIIADPRVFHISDQDFLTMYNRQSRHAFSPIHALF